MPSRLTIPAFNDMASARSVEGSLAAAQTAIDEAWLKWTILSLEDAWRRWPKLEAIAVYDGLRRGRSDPAMGASIHAAIRRPDRPDELLLLSDAKRPKHRELWTSGLPPELDQAQELFCSWAMDGRLAPFAAAVNSALGKEAAWVGAHGGGPMDARALCELIQRGDIWAGIESARIAPALPSGASQSFAPRI